MRLYSGTVNEFLTDTAIVENLENAYKKYYGFVPNRPEVNSWSNSLQAVHLAIYNSKLNNTDIHVVVELELPYNRRRIDVVDAALDRLGHKPVRIVLLHTDQDDHPQAHDGQLHIVTVKAPRYFRFFRCHDRHLVSSVHLMYFDGHPTPSQEVTLSGTIRIR